MQTELAEKSKSISGEAKERIESSRELLNAERLQSERLRAEIREMEQVVHQYRMDEREWNSLAEAMEHRMLEIQEERNMLERALAESTLKTNEANTSHREHLQQVTTKLQSTSSELHTACLTIVSLEEKISLLQHERDVLGERLASREMKCPRSAPH